MLFVSARGPSPPLQLRQHMQIINAFVPGTEASVVRGVKYDFPGTNLGDHTVRNGKLSLARSPPPPTYEAAIKSILSSDMGKFARFIVLHFHLNLHSASYSRLHL